MRRRLLIAAVLGSAACSSLKSTTDRAPAVIVTLDRSLVDVLALGAPAMQVPIHATVKNLLPGEAPTVTFSIVSGDSATIAAGATGGTAMTVVPSSTISFPTRAAPTPTLIRATSDADPSATADLTVAVHAWVDESAAVDSLFPAGKAQLWSVAIAPDGTVMVGGRTTATPAPVAAMRPAGGLAFRAALNGFDNGNPVTDGVITSVAVGLGKHFALAGLTGAADASGNRPLLVLQCAVDPSLCTQAQNVAPTASAWAGALASDPKIWSRQIAPGSDAGPPPSASPRIFVWDFVAGGHVPYLVLAYNVAGEGSCNGHVRPRGHWVYTPLDPNAIHYPPEVTFDGDSPQTPTPFNSCPFTNDESDRVFTGFLQSDGGAFAWLSGYADCPPVAGCAGSYLDGALVSARAGVGDAYYSFASDMDTLGMAGPMIRLGYDGSVLAISTLLSSKADSATLAWYAKTSPEGPLGGGARIPVPTGSRDVGVAIGGAGGGGSTWARATRDLFYSIIRAANGKATFRFGWLPGEDAAAQSVETAAADGDGFQILDLAFAATGGGLVIEGWAVGHRLAAGLPAGPFVAHLE